MGVDACIFAEQANKCFYFDRKHNYLTRWWHTGGNIKDPVADYITDRLDQGRILAEDARYLAEVNIREWTLMDALNPVEAFIHPNDHRVYWNILILQFINEHPNDQFFVISDHDSPDMHDYIKEHGTIEWEPPDEFKR